MHETTAPAQVERWGIYELSLEGPGDGNPFLDVQFLATNLSLLNVPQAIHVARCVADQDRLPIRR